MLWYNQPRWGSNEFIVASIYCIGIERGWGVGDRKANTKKGFTVKLLFAVRFLLAVIYPIQTEKSLTIQIVPPSQHQLRNCTRIEAKRGTKYHSGVRVDMFVLDACLERARTT
jgi:hypothetical protein